MSSFKLRFECDNAAFEENNLPNEVARILRRVAEQIENGHTIGSCIDYNGNRVGGFELKTTTRRKS